MIKSLSLSVILVLCLMLTACAHQVRPNAVSQLDDSAYTFLTVSQVALNATRAEIAAGTLPAAGLPAFNKSVEAYNATRAAWLAYRAGTSNNNQLSDSLAALQKGMQELSRAIGSQP